MNSGRTYYQSTNRISWLRFPWLVIGLAVSAVLASILLNLIFELGWYLVILVPFFVAFLLSVATAGLVAWTQCRNRWVALFLGGLTGAISYLGYFYLSLVFMFNVVPSPSVLPSFIVFRMNNDVVQDVGKPGRDEVAKPTNFMNWFAFLFESAGMIAIPACVGWSRASRGFCEEQRQWLTQEWVSVAPGNGVILDEALMHGDVSSVLPQLTRSGQQQSMATILIEYARPRDERSPIAYPMYLTITDPAKPPSLIQRIGGTNPRSQFQLEPDQILDLMPLFPTLKGLLASKHEDIRQLLDDHGAEQVETVIAMQVASETATVTPVDERYRTQLRTASYKWIVNAIGLSPLIYLAIGGGAIALGSWISGWFEQVVPTINLVSGVLAIVVGVGLIVWGLYLSLYCPAVPENRWINRRLRKLIGMRPDGSEWVNDPNVVYASLIPRSAFSKVQLTMASDVLLVKLDRSRQEIRMCGDSENYVIPSKSLIEYSPELFYHPIDAQKTIQIWMVRLNVLFPSGPSELLLSIDQLSYRRSNNTKRQKTAAEFCEQIASLQQG